MKRAILFLVTALFILLVVEPNIASGRKPVEHKIPVYDAQAALRTNDDVERAASASKATIMIDPARGGFDTGYQVEGQTDEKELAMQWAVAIGSALEKDGYHVIYSRWYDDTGACTSADDCNRQRLEKAREEQADYILSLQFNQDESLHRGWSLFARPDSEKALALANAIAANIQNTGYSRYEGLDTDHYDSFIMLSDPQIPSVLLQLGYLSNSQDYARLSDPAFQSRLAAQIAQAFLTAVN